MKPQNPRNKGTLSKGFLGEIVSSENKPSDSLENTYFFSENKTFLRKCQKTLKLNNIFDIHNSAWQMKIHILNLRNNEINKIVKLS